MIGAFALSLHSGVISVITFQPLPLAGAFSTAPAWRRGAGVRGGLASDAGPSGETFSWLITFFSLVLQRHHGADYRASSFQDVEGLSASFSSSQINFMRRAATWAGLAADRVADRLLLARSAGETKAA